MMKVAQDIILRPIVTERSMEGMAEKKYTFKVARNANKIEIRNAVEKLFGVKVASVNTMNVRGRNKRMGVRMGSLNGKKADWKKAIVTLKEDSKTIEFFDSML